MEDTRLANFSVQGVLGSVLREARLKAGLTQEELAFKAGISRNYVSMLELDQKSPTVQILFKLCRSMGVSAASVITAVERKGR